MSDVVGFTPSNADRLIKMMDEWSRKNVLVGVLIDPDTRRDLLLAWQCGAQFCLTRPPDVAEVVDMVRRVEKLWLEERRSE